ncbi:recombinase family protein [Aurantimicrobium minutum]|uniref:recombinase family protein n=1 Tax=Aurantimicrobium minutum TaxID=708131 RepID=UPI0024769FE4|nr:recombinase family protein [Aurantimicrobium minutum]MDH6240128.1 DNA invertase Pin-like site-specific DNA recombinase [Aurantimicrobium minutum]
MSIQRIGYGRISTTDQNASSQEDALKAAGVDRLFIDTFTGTKASRPELNKLKEVIREGDTLVITRLDRLGRSAKDLLELASELDAKGVQLEVIEQNIDTSTAEGKLFFTLIAAFAEFEREMIRARTMDGLAAARARGKVGGRKPSLSNSQKAEVVKLFQEMRSVEEISELFRVSRPTIYRVIREHQSA